jgi:hypothetical protein
MFTLPELIIEDVSPSTRMSLIWSAAMLVLMLYQPADFDVRLPK